MKNKRLLILDDEPDILEFLSYHFRKEGYDVMTAENALDCLRKADIFAPNLIIADIRMSGMNGLEMCRELKKKDSLKAIPVMFLTADSDEYLALSAFESGGAGYMNKPIKLNLLSNKVSELIHDEMDD
jgi:two-component system alkaline phosphatase synthesis response regulator PhoP